MQTQDKKFIIQCKKREAQALSRFYDLFIKKIYKFVYYKTHHKETAEDLTSLVFTKAFENIEHIDITKSLQAWLYTIARNTVIDHYRTRKSHFDIDDAWGLSSSERLDELVDNNVQLEKVKKYLRNLTSEQRDIVIMRVWQGMSYKEIAQILDKSEASCKMSFSRTMKKLRHDMPLETLLLLLFLNFIV
jgi:RNA polymerase sigma factor (sigma-70 family)